MKKRFPIILLAVASLLLAGCFSSKKATKGQRGQATILATEDPFKSTDEVTITETGTSGGKRMELSIGRC